MNSNRQVEVDAPPLTIGLAGEIGRPVAPLVRTPPSSAQPLSRKTIAGDSVAALAT